MPYSGTGSGNGYDEYRTRSAYTAALTCQYPWTEKETFCDTEEKVDFIKKYTEEYLKVRPFFSEDFYPLTEVSEKLDVWCAMQFNRPGQNDGILEVFRREKPHFETACFMLRGLDETADHLFTDAEGGEFTVSGKELSQNGLKITVPDKRKAKIYFYKTI